MNVGVEEFEEDDEPSDQRRAAPAAQQLPGASLDDLISLQGAAQRPGRRMCDGRMCAGCCSAHRQQVGVCRRATPPGATPAPPLQAHLDPTMAR